MEDLPLPENLDCERFVLGALLSADPARTPVEAILTSLAVTDFSLEKHKLIFRRMGEIQQRGGKIDRVTLAEELGRHKELQSVDGLSYLVSLDDGLPHVHDIDSYISILSEKAMSRKLITDIQSIERRAYGGEAAIGLVEELRRIGDGIQPVGDQEFETAESIIEGISIQELVRPKQIVGIDPPTAWLRNYLRFEPGTLTTLAARTSQGKSAFAAQCMLKAAQDGYRVALFSLEMSSTETLRRMTGQFGRVNMHRLRIGQGDKEEAIQASHAAANLAGLGDKLLFCSANAGTIPAVRKRLQRMKLAGRPIDFVIVDYLQLMSGVGRFENRTQEVSSLSRGTKMIAQDFGIPVMILSQLRRGADGAEREPRLDDLRESGSIEQDSDNVMFLHRKGRKEEEIQAYKLLLEKVRNGPCGYGDMVFVKRYARFEDVEGRPVAA